MAKLPNSIPVEIVGFNSLIELEALRAELVGMVADNEQRKVNGCTTFNYAEKDFLCYADKMRDLKNKNIEKEIQDIIHDIIRFYTTTPGLTEADITKLDFICDKLRKVYE